MSSPQPKPVEWFVHITRENGDIVAVAKEMVIPGPIVMVKNGRICRIAAEIRGEVPIWKREVSRIEGA